MRFNKACDINDFYDPLFNDTCRRIFGPQEIREEGWPAGFEDRKFWEIVLVIMATERFLPPGMRHFALGVGSGIEGTNFALTNYFDWVYATDLYVSGGWPTDAPLTMLNDPTRFAGTIPWNPGRLIVGHLDGRLLRVHSNSVDLIYSSSSIEHFGSLRDIAQAAKEMGRVVRKGGLIAISTELSLTGRRGKLGPNTILLTQEDIQRHIIDASGCTPVDTPDYSGSCPFPIAVPFQSALRDLELMTNRLQTRWSQYPHVVISQDSHAWTSAQITLMK